MECRLGCGACCIAPSITSPIPGMSGGKPAGVRCIQLSPENMCKLFGMPERPLICRNFTPCGETCGESFHEAYSFLADLEKATTPDKDR